ncbi:ATP-binding cassette domain-containing protein [Rhizobium sp.]|uniref:ABC transporter ATP-binding protein n=1 Tax=Rhizobium sp. TaxID=391 RepID=UPI0034C614A6
MKDFGLDGVGDEKCLALPYGKQRLLEIALAIACRPRVLLLDEPAAGVPEADPIVGLTRYRSGSIRLRGTDIQGMSPERRVEAGIGWVPQERGIFRSLTVEENITAVARPGRWTLSAIYDLFPRLKERRSNLGNQLSGGEQQMLSIGRALVLNPILLLLDEPTEGLAPIIVEELLAAIRRIVRDEGLAAIIIEQHAQQLLAITDKAIILDRGSVAYSGDSGHLAEDSQTLGKFLGVGATE